jgi:glycosyltransferase involved in cell wall biosynthesis
MDSPGVSAIVPIKNGSDYIATSIPRILQNLRHDDELLVIDDSSTDNSEAAVIKAANGDPRLKLFQSPGVGIVDALNHGLIQAKYESIARFDIDDIYSLNRLEKQRDLLRGNVLAVFCDYNIIDSEENLIGTIFSPILPNVTKLSLSQSQRTPHPGVVFSKLACIKVGGYRKVDEGVEDLSLWLRLSMIGDLISVPEVLFSYRIHKNSVTFSRREAIQNRKIMVLDEFPLREDELRSLRQQLDDIISFYKTAPNSYMRILLMFRELILIGSGKTRLLSFVIVTKSLLKLNLFQLARTTLQISLESRRRRTIRSV